MDASAKTAIDLQGAPYSRVYCGGLDLVNGFDEQATFTNTLKFQALFYDRILVPDCFLHCYGPAFYSVTRVVNSDVSSQSNEILAFLQSGALVPVLREGDSLLQNFVNRSRGIQPGTLLFPPLTKVTRKVLEEFERHTTTVARWPKPMADSKNPEYSAILRALFVGTLSSHPLISAKAMAFFLQLPRENDRKWRKLHEDFCSVIHTQANGAYFRRGHLEEVVAQNIGVPIREVYESIHASSGTFDPSSPQAKVARYLMEVTATVYESYQADQFKAVGGLFPRFKPGLIDPILYSQLGPIAQGFKSVRREPLPTQYFKASKIPAQKIIHFRTTTIFGEYQQKLNTLVTPPKGVSFYEANREYFDFVSKRYIRELVNLLPEVVSGSAIKQTSTLIRYLAFPSFFYRAASSIPHDGSIQGVLETITVLGVPLFVIVGAADWAEKNSDWLASRVTAARDWIAIEKARRRLNHFIAKRAP